MPSPIIRTALTDALTALQNLLADEETLARLDLAGKAMAATLKNGGRVFSCGNGGSMCDAMHFAEELSGRYRNDRPALAAASISDPSHMSCVGNDYGYDFVFSRYIEAHGRPGDVLLAISTSGKSPNVLNVIDAAKKRGMKVVGMTGKRECPMTHLCDILLATPGGAYADRTQELHIKLIHIMIETVENEMFGTSETAQVEA